MGKHGRVVADAHQEQSLTWRLSDDGMDLLERAGLAGLYMVLRAASEQRVDLSPLTWHEDDLQPDSVTVRWIGPAKPAFVKLMEWAWQVRDGVLLFPAIHGERERLALQYRVASHNGIMRTFLQHVNSQPKLDTVTKVIPLDEDRSVNVSFEPPATRVDDTDREMNPKTKRLHKKKVPADRVRPHEDLEKLFSKKGEFVRKDASLSNWLYPGIAGRYGGEQSWVGTPQSAVLLMLAPTVCLFLRLQGEGGNWVIVVPDVRNLRDFAATRPRMVLNPDFSDVASLGDAGLQFLAEYATRHPRRQLASGCRVVAMGYVRYYQGQSIRKSVLDVPSSLQAVKRYRLLQSVLANQYVPLKADAPEEATKEVKAKGRSKKAFTTGDKIEPQPKGFIKLPSARGRIADNLVSGRAWYADLFVPLVWDLNEAERERKRLRTSLERAWFQAVSYQRSKLMKLITEDDMWDTEAEKVFVDAFWQALDSLYAQEARATERGGSRSATDRFEDLNDDIRRKLMQAKTRMLLRSALSDLFAKAGRQNSIRNHPAAIWRLIDHPDHWRKGRDLALLALASHRKREERAAVANSSTSDGA
jgi:CRISPR-associated protein Cas8a1/Csx13